MYEYIYWIWSWGVKCIQLKDETSVITLKSSITRWATSFINDGSLRIGWRVYVIVLSHLIYIDSSESPSNWCIFPWSSVSYLTMKGCNTHAICISAIYGTWHYIMLWQLHALSFWADDIYVSPWAQRIVLKRGDR